MMSVTGARLWFLVAVGVALAFGFLATGADAGALAVHAAGPELTRLLRGMALIKATLAALAGAAVFWRLQFPAVSLRAGAYICASAAMAAGPGLVWGMAHVVAGAMLLHAGLLAAVLLGWRDEVVTRAVPSSLGLHARRAIAGHAAIAAE